MPDQRDFLISLAEGVRMRVGFRKERGHIMEFVAQLETWLEIEWVAVVRYDNAHGFPRSVGARASEILALGWLTARLDRPISPQRAWEVLRAVGFTPQRPRPAAVRADPEAQEAFKKGGSPTP